MELYPFLFKMLLKQFSNVLLEAWFQARDGMEEGEMLPLTRELGGSKI